MESKVHQSLRNIFYRDAALFSDRAHIQDALVRHRSGATGVENWEVAAKSRRHVVRVKNGDLRCRTDPFCTECRNVGPADRQDARASVWCRRDASLFAKCETWKERREMFHHTDWPHPWSATTMGNCERLVQIEMTDIGAECAWLREADLRIHVCAVHIDLSAGRVHRVADLANRLFKDAVRARVGHHQRAE